MSSHHPTFGRLSGIGSMFKLLTNSLKTSSSKTQVPVLINPTVVGGGSDQQRIVQQLRAGPLPGRAAAANQMVETLEKYSISSVPEIWYLARDMCDSRLQLYIRRAALSLLVQCVKRDEEGSVSGKLMYFKDIIHFCQLSDSKVDPEFDLFLKALRTLTDDGRDIHDLCIIDLDRNLVDFVILSLEALGSQSKQYTAADSEESLKDDETFQNLLRVLLLTRNCLKFNSNAIEDSLVAEILLLVLEIAFRTTNSAIIYHCLELISALVTFGTVPMEILYEVVQFVCLVYGLSDEITSVAWETINGLCSESTFHIVLSHLCDIVLNSDLQLFRLFEPTWLSAVTSNTSTINTLNNKESDRPLAACIGAIQILERIQFLHTLDGSSYISFAYVRILKAFSLASSYNVPLVNTTLWRSFDRLLSKEPYEDLLGPVMKPPFEKLFPFQVWYSSSISVYDVLKGLKLNSDQDISYWKSVCDSLQSLYETRELHTPKERLVAFFLQHYLDLSLESKVFILSSYREDKSCSQLNPFWKESCNQVLNYFYYPSSGISLETEVRVEALRIIKEGHDISSSIFEKNKMSNDIIFEIFRKSTGETDEAVIAYLIDSLFTSVVSRCTLSFFKELMSIFIPYFHVKQRSDKLKTFLSASPTGSISEATSATSFTGGRGSYHYGTGSIRDHMSPYFLTKICEALCHLFVVSSTNDGPKALETYLILTIISQYAIMTEESDLLLSVARCLIRLRVTSEGHIFFAQPLDMDGLATVFGRNIADFDSSAGPSEANLAWVYPEDVSFLPQEYFNRPSKRLVLLQPKINSLVPEEEGESKIDISKWLAVALTIAQDFYEWEIYSYVWGHLCSQLSNMTLFEHNRDQIVQLKNIVCDQLMLKLPSKLQLPTVDGKLMTKAELQVAFVRTFSALLGYHEHFSKFDQDQIVSALLFGLGSWEKTAIPCIHILTVCCYEIPLSIKKFLSAILTKLQTRVTSAFASAHTLELLMSLAHLPGLTSNFNTDDFRRVFAIAFKYIQYANDIIIRNANDKKNSEIVLQAHGIDAQVERKASTQATELTPILTQYLLTLSYNVISSWLLKIDISERKDISDFLVKNLILSNSSDKLDDQTVAFLDIIMRFTHSSIPSKILNPSAITDTLRLLTEAHIDTSRWIVGHSVISVDANVLNGESILTIRRPSGVSIFRLALDKAMLLGLPKQKLVDSSYIFLQTLQHWDENNKSKPLLLVEDPITLRALLTLDRTPMVDFHKVGIVYMSPGQTTETQILGNRSGSRLYQHFLSGIGRLQRLKGRSDVYLGGLDTENDVDGQYALVWSDELTQVVFHTTTMIPNTTTDAYFDLKKRHIGNNHVNVFFDESGQPFNFNVIRSQFNFLNIVVSPHTVRGPYSASQPTRFFKVKTYRRAGVPGIFATCHFKIVLAEQVAVFVRNLALLCSQFAAVWHANGTHRLTWANRARQIGLLQEKTVRDREDQPETHDRHSLLEFSSYT